MADRINIGQEERVLKLGSSFTNPRDCAFHTIRYDFKPASIDTNKMATIDVGEKNEIQVNFPSNLVFQGSAKPYQKQCVLIYNHDTGEVKLEKLSNNISVKRQRNESKITGTAQKMPTFLNATTKAKKQSSSKSNSNHNSKSNASKTNGKTKSKSQNLAASLGSLVPKHSPLHASPNRKSPNPVRFSPNQPTLNASLPNIGADDLFGMQDWVQNTAMTNYNTVEKKPEKNVMDRKITNMKKDVRNRPVNEPPAIKIEPFKPEPNFGLSDAVGELSDSSSSSSSSSGSDDSSSSDSDEPPKRTNPQNLSNQSNGSLVRMMPEILKEDLQLSSESGSDSD